MIRQNVCAYLIPDAYTKIIKTTTECMKNVSKKYQRNVLLEIVKYFTAKFKHFDEEKKILNIADVRIVSY